MIDCQPLSRAKQSWAHGTMVKSVPLDKYFLIVQRLYRVLRTEGMCNFWRATLSSKSLIDALNTLFYAAI